MPEVELLIGPQHPALKEPVNFKVVVDGERIVRLDLDISYNHRGIEKAAETRDFSKSMYLLERICGICSHAHTTVFSKGIETLMNIEPPPRGKWIRTLVAELERIHSHLLWLGVAAHEIGYNTLFMYTWRDRETVQNILEMISGNRVNYGMNAIGGVRRDLSDPMRQRVLEGLRLLAERADYYLEVVPKEETLVVRTRGVGRLATDKAIELGAVGPTARGSNVPFDVRRDDPYLAYGDVPFDVITSTACDVFGRVEVRVKELVQSVRMCIHMVENLPPGEILVKPPRTAPAGEYVSRLEAPRGELLYFLRTRGTDKVDRVSVRTPTLANWPSVVSAIQGHVIADIPVVVAAIDPCLSCTSRMTFTDVDRGERSSLSWDELVEYGIRYYREKEGL
ncbi:MAG: NADH dehydrogenase [Euryarchaeota archaeon RBG_16_68_12]|nr:MAG: NADH dehydrogenase [Euryarchaeota archaeon RBG_16_68_12]